MGGGVKYLLYPTFGTTNLQSFSSEPSGQLLTPSHLQHMLYAKNETFYFSYIIARVVQIQIQFLSLQVLHTEHFSKASLQTLIDSAATMEN